MSRKAALITGASSGLGEQLAGLFARDGHDVILVARAPARLEAVAARLETAHRVRAYVVAADLSEPGAPRRVFDELEAKGLPVSFLVNCAGFGSNGPFLDLDLDEEARMVEVNCQALLKLTHLVGNSMRARGEGRILNIASTAGFQPGPFMATYYATKAFVVSFSEALAHELKDTGVTVTCYCPGAVHTGFSARAGNDKSRLFKQMAPAKAPEVAEDAYEAMLQGEVLAVHGFLNWLMMEAVRVGPRAVVRSVSAGINQPPGT